MFFVSLFLISLLIVILALVSLLFLLVASFVYSVVEKIDILTSVSGAILLAFSIVFLAGLIWVCRRRKLRQVREQTDDLSSFEEDMRESRERRILISGNQISF
jgi:hypothetical protein